MDSSKYTAPEWHFVMQDKHFNVQKKARNQYKYVQEKHMTSVPR